MSDGWAGKGADSNREVKGSSPGALQCITIWIFEKDKKNLKGSKRLESLKRLENNKNANM